MYITLLCSVETVSMAVAKINLLELSKISGNKPFCILSVVMELAFQLRLMWGVFSNANDIV